MLRTARRSLGLSSAIVAFCALAASPLAFTPIFAVDWVNHGWFASYVAHVLTAEWVVPMFVSTPAVIGNPVLTFYGTALYVALSPFVRLFGPDVGMRAAAVAAMVAPSFAMARLFLALGVDRFTTACLTVCLSSSVYQLTNLYTRGAVTEFFSYQLILLGGVVLLSVFAGEGRQRHASRLVFGSASLALGALAHPPSFVLAGLFLGLPAAVLGKGIVFPAATASIRRQPLAWTVVATMLAPVTLWFQVVVAHRGKLAMTEHASVLLYFPWSIDHWIARLFPFPLDLRVLTDGYNLVPFPFLSAPVNSAALLLAGLAALGCYRRPGAPTRRNVTEQLFVVAVFVAIAASLLLSLPIVRTEPNLIDGKPTGVVHALPDSAIGRVLGSVQFAYRLVNIVNLASILAVLGICVLRSRMNRDRSGWRPSGARWRHLLVAATAVSTAAIASKVLEVHLEFTALPSVTQQLTPLAKPADGMDGMQLLAAHGMRGWTTPESLAANRLAMRAVDKIPSSQYGIGFYAMDELSQPYAPRAGYDELVLPLTMVGHSRAQADVRCERLCAIHTNLMASPWATITLDGRRVPRSQLATRPGALVTILTGRGQHQIEVQLGSPQTAALSWGILWLVVVFWVSGVAVLVGELLRRARNSPQPA